MKVFLSSTYNDLIEHRKAAHDENHPRMKPRIREYEPSIREFVKIFVDGLPKAQEALEEIEKAMMKDKG